MTGAPVAAEMSRASPTWSAWPCVSTIWVTPLIAAALSDTKAGLPVKNGSISTALPAKSSRKAEWPYQVICMMAVLGWDRLDWSAGRYATGRQDQRSCGRHCRLDPAISPSLPSLCPNPPPQAAGREGWGKGEGREGNGPASQSPDQVRGRG